MKSFFVAGLGLLAITVAGCGETPVQPSAANTNIFLPVLSGPWFGQLDLAAVTGGECVGQDYSRALATQGISDDGTVTLLQAASDPTQMTAVVRSVSTGSSCTYTGTTGVNLFALTAEASCGQQEIYVQCSNGQTRVLTLLTSTMNAIPQGGSASGIIASSYNVSAVDATGARRPLAGLTLQYSFNAVRP